LTPRATYRLQLSKQFGFQDAAKIAPYLASLSVSHVYTSPYLRARPGSQHGYDVTDFTQLNPELGDENAFLAMMEAFRANGLEHILDYVPNHMGIGGSDNSLWLDVLELGRDSEYANWFDIDWDSPLEELRGKILTPFLANQYGIELAAGKLQLKFDAEKGEFDVWLYGAHKLPIAPRTYPHILDSEEFAWLTEELNHPGLSQPEKRQRLLAIKERLAHMAKTDPQSHTAIERAVAKFSGIEGQPDSWRPLANLILAQNWRPSHYRVAADAINYRRFFNINELAGIRMELPAVFEHAHSLVLDLIRKGQLQGLRIDHIDGLYDPKQYLERLRAGAGACSYLVVEKILTGSEKLREDWRIEGTTGYEFCNQVLGLLIDPAAETILTDFYRVFASESRSFVEIVLASKLAILDNELAGELETLSFAAASIARQDPSTADFTRHILWRALRSIVANFPVYRTYVDGGPRSETDNRYIHWAVAQANKSDPEVDKSAFDFLETLLDGSYAERADPCLAKAAIAFAMKIQQISAPVMAKGTEDTALYRYNRLVALNEVGGSPTQFGCSVSRFHKENQYRSQTWPRTMLTTSTHDTKHGEDARARLAAICLLPEQWIKQAAAWSRLLRARRGDIEGITPPARNDEYLFYQNLAATWPPQFVSFDSVDRSALSTYTERVQKAQQKSMREARTLTNWTSPDMTYEAAVADFIADALNPEKSEVFLRKFIPFQRRLSRWGVHNSLVQVFLKICSPGLPDFYQGSELWNFHLQDPDNRTPVDYNHRKSMLAKIEKRLARDHTTAFESFLRNPEDGSIKLALTTTLLGFRRKNAALFETGSYEPLAVTGEENLPICAFRRTAGDKTCVAVTSLDARRRAPTFNHHFLSAPGQESVTQWHEIIADRPVPSRGGQLLLSEILGVLPVALLVPE
jgi:(1->4)-alpha-D-glucan 1-alpha-D-glucosylmutase